MALGQQSGPPAGSRLVQQLVDLVIAAGFNDLRDARHPLGLTQRQAGGKFTVGECEELIARLSAQSDETQTNEGPAAAIDVPLPLAEPTPARAKTTAAPRARTTEEREAARATALQRIPTEMLAGELQRRGWIVIEP